MTNNQAKADTIPFPLERRFFKTLLAQNPNYFGNLADSPFKPVKTILGNTTYEEISSVGYNPATTVLEATITAKFPLGHDADPCHAESFEYIRFYLDDGSGWKDAGVVEVSIHDMSNKHDCSDSAGKPKTYVVSHAIDMPLSSCWQPAPPKVRVILSWNQIPPPTMPNWSPVWGNVVDPDLLLKLSQ